jgi:hypothetical protein
LRRKLIAILSTLPLLGAGASSTALAAGETVTPVAPDGAVAPVPPGGAKSGETVTPVPQPQGTTKPGEVVTPVESGAAGASTKIQAAKPGQVVWLTHDLKLRDAPGLKGRVLTTIKAKTGMTVTGQTLDRIDGFHWLRVEGEGKRGFIANLDLTKDEPKKKRGTPT